MKKPATCRACGAQLPPKAKVCPFCGKKRKKPVFRWLLLLIVVSTAFSVAVNLGEAEKRSSTELGRGMGLNQEQEEHILNIFAQCGIRELYSVQVFQEGEDKTSYHVEDIETQAYGGMEYTIVVWLDNETKDVREIYFHDQDIYLEGQVLAKVSDFYVAKEDRDQYRAASQMLVNQILLLPDSAKYPAQSGWAFALEDGTVIVQSSVTSKNAFNVEITNRFQVKFENGTPTSLIVDGKEYIQ